MTPCEERGQARWQVLLALLGLATLAAVLMPGEGLRWLRIHSDWFDRYVLWNDAQPGLLDVGHLVLFGFLGFVAARALRTWRFRSKFAMLVMLGIVSELAQLWIPGRHARLSDFLADAIAAACGLWLARRLNVESPPPRRVGNP